MSVLSDIMRGAASRSGAAVGRLLQQEENRLQREHETELKQRAAEAKLRADAVDRMFQVNTALAESGAYEPGMSSIPGTDPGFQAISAAHRPTSVLEQWDDDTGQGILYDPKTRTRTVYRPEGWTTDAEGGLPGGERWAAWLKQKSAIYTSTQEAKRNPYEGLRALQTVYLDIFGKEMSDEEALRAEEDLMQSSMKVVSGQLGETQKKDISGAFNLERSASRLRKRLADPAVRESLGQWKSRQHDIERWITSWGEDSKEWSEEQAETFQAVEAFLTDLGLTQDLVVRMRSGAAVPETEAARFARMLGSHLSSPLELEARMTQMETYFRRMRGDMWAQAAIAAYAGFEMPPQVQTFLNSMGNEWSMPETDPAAQLSLKDKLKKWQELDQLAASNDGTLDPEYARQYEELSRFLEDAGIIQRKVE
jgi:hypothetical protein